MSTVKHTLRVNCKFCGALFDSFNLKKVCPTCDKNMDEYFKQIRAFLETCPDATSAEVCEALGIPLPIITFFIKEERLIVKNKKKGTAFQCEICHKPILSGRFCFDCSITIARSEMKTGLSHEEPERASQKFHTRGEIGNKRL
ncbi:MAG: flagellar operon protein YvyF [Clostridiales bacterium]|jgi:ribosomal protein L32|nr:flagellar operon protein YvyF [Clostridiales bacterium]